MAKVVSIDEAINHIEDGMTIMVGGFLSCGTPHKLVDKLVEKGVKDLTLISNDSGFVDSGVGKLVVNKQIKKLIASHVGTNRETGNQMNSGEMEVNLVPQGTLAEQIEQRLLNPCTGPILILNYLLPFSLP
jgi:acetate CoA/acetoacetate CoA-transferase alpha subunit